jgi:hypothetical protein
MFFIRIIFILVSLLCIASLEASFAGSDSGSTNTGALTTIKVKEIEKSGSETVENITTEEEKIEEKKTEKNAQKIILEVYKIQWNKILKDMDVSIEKLNSDPKIRIDIYSSIQKTLEFRKQKVEKSIISTEGKWILVWYIDYMVTAIEKKKKNLE